MRKAAKLVVLCAALLCAITAFSAEKLVKFSSPVDLNGTTLQPGEYDLRYTINGDNVDVQFVKGKKTVATGSAQLVEAKKTNRDTIVTRGGSEGKTELVSIQFANQQKAIAFATAGSGGSN